MASPSQSAPHRSPGVPRLLRGVALLSSASASASDPRTFCDGRVSPGGARASGFPLPPLPSFLFLFPFPFPPSPPSPPSPPPPFPLPCAPAARKFSRGVGGDASRRPGRHGGLPDGVALRRRREDLRGRQGRGRGVGDLTAATPSDRWLATRHLPAHKVAAACCFRTPSPAVSWVTLTAVTPSEDRPVRSRLCLKYTVWQQSHGYIKREPS